MHTQAFGGIALRFADGHGFGDSYAEGHFYGVNDGFGSRAVARHPARPRPADRTRRSRAAAL